MIRQENIVPPWKSIPLSTCPHPRRVMEDRSRGDGREEQDIHTIVIPAQDDDTKLATPNSTAAIILRLSMAIK